MDLAQAQDSSTLSSLFSASGMLPDPGGESGAGQRKIFLQRPGNQAPRRQSGAANQATEAANQGASEAARGAADEVSGMGHPGTDTPCAPARLQTIHVGRLVASWMKQIREIKCPLQTAVKGSTAAENLTGESFFGCRIAMCHE